MPAQNHFRNELDTMRSLSYVIEERGIEKGIKQERLNIVNTAYACRRYQEVFRCY